MKPMRWHLRRKGWAVVVGLAMLPAALQAANPPTRLCDLDGLSTCALEALYRAAEPGAIPCGFQRGRVFYPCDTPLAGCREKIANLLWRGKHIDCCRLTSINQWPGLKAIRSEVSVGDSWLDGKPAIVLDYRRSSFLWRDVRDEMRQIAPGLYLGIMVLDRCPCPQRKLFFAIETAGCCPK